MAPPASRRPPKAPTSVVTAAGKTVQLLGKPKKQHTAEEQLKPPPKEVRPKKLYGGQVSARWKASTVNSRPYIHMFFLTFRSFPQEDAKTVAQKEAAKKSEAAKKANANRIDRTQLPTFMAAGAQQPLANLSRKELQARAIAAGLKANAKSAEIIKGALLPLPLLGSLDRSASGLLMPLLLRHCLCRTASVALLAPLRLCR